jgi:ubiquinone/menaquinone biosynthesis C-methylase UbiE
MIKGEKVISVLTDYFGQHKDICNMKLLDVGCSTGIQTSMLSEVFYESTGLDIDESAVAFAQQNFKKENLKYIVGDSLKMPFEEESFDVVVCSQVYEHVPDPKQLMSEIYRVLRIGGVCFFSAANKYCIIEPHYFLFLLSWLPKSLANRYVRLAGKAEKYYENLYSYSKLIELTSKFENVDYTAKVLQNPEKYRATDMLRSGTLKHKVALLMCRFLYGLVPNYIWILQKK